MIILALNSEQATYFAKMAAVPSLMKLLSISFQVKVYFKYLKISAATLKYASMAYISSLYSGQTRVLVSIIFFSSRGIKMYLQNHFAIFGMSASMSAMIAKNCWIPTLKSGWENSFNASSLSNHKGMCCSISLSLASNKFSKNFPISSPPTGNCFSV